MLPSYFCRCIPILQLITMLFKGIEPDGHIAKMLTIPEEASYSTTSDESNTSFQIKKENNSEIETPAEMSTKSQEVTLNVQIQVSHKRKLSSTGSKSPTSCKKVCLDEGSNAAVSGDSSYEYFEAITTKNTNDKNEKNRIKDADHSSSETSTGFTQTNAKKDHALQLLKDNVEKAKLRANELSSSDEMR